jgi:hypothetical protein
MSYCSIPEVRLHPHDWDHINEPPIKAAFEERAQQAHTRRTWLAGWQSRLLDTLRLDAERVCIINELSFSNANLKVLKGQRCFEMVQLLHFLIDGSRSSFKSFRERVMEHLRGKHKRSNHAPRRCTTAALEVPDRGLFKNTFHSVF